MNKHTLFISDLHLQASRPDIVDIFRRFMQGPAVNAEAVYILGDLFEVWIGDDDHTAFNHLIKSIIRQLTHAGVPVYVMQGNRDFLLNRGFAIDTGCQLIADPTVINLYGRRILLKHGDDLCTDDLQHIRFRKKIHNPSMQKLFLLLPLCVRRWIAKKIRRISTRHNRNKSVAIMDVTASAVEQTMQASQVTLLIHGHTHRPNIHTLQVDEQPAERIVLAAWHDHGNALIYPDSGKYELISIV